MPIAVLLAGLAVPVRAESCAELLRQTLDSGRVSAIVSCFQPGTDWLDGSGRRAGPGAVALGLESLIRAQARADAGGPTLSETAGAVFVSGFHSPKLGPASLLVALRRRLFPAAQDRWNYVLVADRSPRGWAHPRLYYAAAPWPAAHAPHSNPESAQDRGASAPAAPVPRRAASRDGWKEGLEGFNVRFSTGDVPGWLAHWHPQATFYSGIGPLRGEGIRDFFRNQARRYIGPHLRIERDHGGASGPIVFEGRLQGRCRKDGNPFQLQVLMDVRMREGRIEHLQEAFIALNDGCGPFWAGDG